MSKDHEAANPLRKPLKIGHRGAAGHAPENTISAIKKGIQLGVDFVEFDVRQTSDRTFVLFHDRTLARLGKSEPVRDLPWSRMQNLDLNSGHRIPTLRDALTEISGTTGVMIELKDERTGEDVCQVIEDMGFRGPVIYASFWHEDLVAIRRKRPSAQTLALIEAVPVNVTAFAEEARVTHVGLALDCVNEAYVSALQRKGLAVFVYTVDEPADIQWLAAIGVEGIVSNFPDRL